MVCVEQYLLTGEYGYLIVDAVDETHLRVVWQQRKYRGDERFRGKFEILVKVKPSRAKNPRYPFTWGKNDMISPCDAWELEYLAKYFMGGDDDLQAYGRSLVYRAIEYAGLCV